MLAKERLVYIINRLQVRPSISVQELSREMNVSLSTVQRDLIKLEKEGRIERSRGGAISHRVSEMLSGESDIAVSEKIHLHQAEKEIIAKNAIKFIKDGECIFLDSGTTIAHLVPYIMNRNITIVTNSMELVPVLAESDHKIIILGGTYSKRGKRTFGGYSLEMLDSLYFDLSFIGMDGCKDIDGPATTSEEETYINKIVLRRSKKNIIISDSSKFENHANFQFAKFSDFDLLITNKISEDEKRRIGIEVIEAAA